MFAFCTLLSPKEEGEKRRKKKPKHPYLELFLKKME